MARSSAALVTVEGTVIDGNGFTNLYRLLDLERAATAEAQTLTMPAAFEILAAYEDDEWRRDMEAEHQAEIDRTGFEPRWSPTSSRAFARWLEARAEKDGHPFIARRTIRNLLSAAECYRETRRELGARAPSLPETEKAWRPAEGLLTKGFRKQIAATVVKANEIAEEEGEPGVISQRRMLLAKREVWNTDPQIQEWVKQPGLAKFGDNRSAHDRVVTALNKIRKEANDLRKAVGDDPKAWAEFLAGLAEIK